MPRTARRISRSGTYHVMFRGNELRDIFTDNEDRNRFLHLLEEKATEEEFTIYAYCLMPNHVHILLSGEHEALGKLIKRINTSFVYYFNKKYDRLGHLFHDRYKSQPVETEVYLLAAVRYIHNNPVKAGLAEKPYDYKWSSYRSYVDYRQDSKNCFDPLYILKMFSEDIEKGKKLFKVFSKENEADNFDFVDVAENEIKNDKEIKGEAAARKFIDHFLKTKNLKIEDLLWKDYEDIRNELIVELRERSNLSIRQLASILGIGRGIIQRQDRPGAKK